MEPRATALIVPGALFVGEFVGEFVDMALGLKPPMEPRATVLIVPGFCLGFRVSGLG
jgi:hypothetical protein